jgi:hypothetical protein
MNRAEYFNYIVDKLTVLSSRVETRGKLNFLDLHIHSENFYRDLLNILFDWNLKNQNSKTSNAPAIDLIDEKRKIFVQVSATSTKRKIDSSLNNVNLKNYQDFTFKFLSISKDADNLRKNHFTIPHNVNFSPVTDIIDVNSILSTIHNFDIDKQKITFDFIKKELGSVDIMLKLNSNLTSVVTFLSDSNLKNPDPIKNINAFEIDRKIEFNQLKTTESIIGEYKIFFNTLNKIYKEFDKSGSNKSLSVLSSIQSHYINSISEVAEKDSDGIFLDVIEKVKVQIIDSKNFNNITTEELDLCVKIIVVDAFIRCKIFKNPMEYCYVTSR